MARKRLTQKEAEDTFAEYGYILKDTYVRAQGKILVICPVGHNWNTDLNHFKNGRRCLTCSGHNKYTQQVVKDILEKEGYLLLGEYKNCDTSVEMKCPDGHVTKRQLNHFIEGHRCSDCAGNKQLTLKSVRETFAKDGYSLLSTEYKNTSTPVLVTCPKGHPWEPTVSNFKSHGKRCPKCSNTGTSKLEEELFNIIKSLFPSAKKLRKRKIKIENRPYIYGFDIDIFIPELNLGIEFDGKYHHSVEYLRESKPHWPEEAILNYHKIKDDYFLNNHGIRILHIKEMSWRDNRQDCIDECLKFLNFSIKEVA